MALQEGKKAPSFTAKDQDGESIKLSDFKGKKLALYFYPRMIQVLVLYKLVIFVMDLKMLAKKGIEVIGVSPDDEKSHTKFIAKHKLPFRIIADTEKKLVEKYGVWGEKQLYGNKYMGVFRTTFLIDENGVIAKIISKPKVKEHSKEIAAGFGL